jgi:hypothetical protein
MHRISPCAVLVLCRMLLADDAADLARAAKSPYDLARFLRAHPKMELGIAGNILDTPWPRFPADSVELIAVPRPEQVHHNILMFGSKPLLRVTAAGAYGSGLGSDMEDWMDLTASKFEPVFTYSPSGDLDAAFEGHPGHR